MEARFKSSITSPKISGFEWREPEDSSDLDTFRDIATVGCSILKIIPDEEDTDSFFDYFYTIGFYLNLIHPELLIMGMSHTGDMMNDLFSYVESGHSIGENHTVRYDLGQGEVKFVAKPVLERHFVDYLGYGCWFYRSLFSKPPCGTHKFPVLQLFWPDKRGYYPWDPQCDPRSKEIQILKNQKA